MLKQIKTLIAITALAIVVSITPTDKANATVAINQTSVESVAKTNSTIKKGWIKENGKWRYYIQGSICRDKWVYDNGAWYHFSIDGYMQTGWIRAIGPTINKKETYWFYLNSNGKMVTGLHKIGKYYYYFYTKDYERFSNPIGAMADTIADFFLLHINGKEYICLKNGKICNSWMKLGDHYYYCSIKNGKPEGIASVPINNKTTKTANFYFDCWGRMETGIIEDNNKLYYFSPSSGKMLYGWKKFDNNKWRYFDTERNGAALVSVSKKIGNKMYKFDKNGWCLNP